MINSVSGVSFKANDAQNIINAPGRYTTQTSDADMQADAFTSSQKPKKKSKALAVIGTLAALAVAATVTLGILSHKGKLTKIEGAEKFMDKAKNALATAGEWIAEKGSGVWQWAKGLLGGGKKDAVQELADEIEFMVL